MTIDRIRRRLPALVGALGLLLVGTVVAASPAAADASECDSVSGNVVQNCGFENGQAPWTVVRSPNGAGGDGVYTVPFDPYPHSGTGSFLFTTDGTHPTQLSQQLAGTRPNTTYQLSYWMMGNTAQDGGPANSFSVTISSVAGGTRTVNLVTTPGYWYWTQYTAAFHTDAAGDAPTITFNGQATSIIYSGGAQLSGVVRLDDVVVVPGPAIPSLGTTPSGTVAGGSVSDTATLVDGYQPSGAVAFDLYGPDDPTCTGSPLAQTSGTVIGGAAQSGPVRVTEAGTYHWSASYPGDANNEPASSACGEPTLVTPGAVYSLTLAPATATVSYGQTQAYTATGFDQFGNPLGSESGVTYAISPVGSCSGTTCGGEPGTHKVTGTKGAASGTATLIVTKAKTNTTLTQSSAAPGLDQPVTYTATVDGVAGAATPTGTVTFTVDGAPAATVSVNAAGVAAFTAEFGAGSHAVVASYSGDARYLPSASDAEIATVACAITVTGTSPGFAVHSGLTCVVGATVTGAITVFPGGALDVERSTVTEPITSALATGVRVCGSTTGDITVSGSTGFVLVGEPAHGCAANSVVNGVIVALGNTGGVVIEDNAVAHVEARGNSGTGPLGQPVTVSGNH